MKRHRKKHNPKLDREFSKVVHKVLARVSAEGYKPRPYQWIRDPWAQARLWRQSRSIGVIEDKAHQLKKNNAPWLARVLIEVGPQHGPKVTNAVPGESWHQWGEAVDIMMLADTGEPIWDGGFKGYQCLAKNARDLGLTSGFYWTWKDSGHLQKRPGSVKSLYQWPDIESKMVARYSDLTMGGL